MLKHFLGRAKLFIYQVKSHSLHKKSNDPQNCIRLLNKLCSKTVY